MPNYRYRAREEGAGCEACQGGFELLQAISDAPLEACPECDAPVRRVIGKIVFNANPKNTKKMLSDGNLKRLGFKKLVKESDGQYRDVLQD